LVPEPDTKHAIFMIGSLKKNFILSSIIFFVAFQYLFYEETAEIPSINPLYPPILGGLLKAGGTPPRPPA